jgi:hypothetical protein
LRVIREFPSHALTFLYYAVFALVLELGLKLYGHLVLEKNKEKIEEKKLSTDIENIKLVMAEKPITPEQALERIRKKEEEQWKKSQEDQDS